MESVKWLSRCKQIATEIAIIVIASSIVIISLRAIEHFKAPQNPAAFALGAQLKIANTDLSKAPLSVVLFTSPTCPYCLASKSFHSRLSEESSRRHVPFFVAVPSHKEASSYLREVGFPQSAVKDWADLNMRVNATPTIVLLDSGGTVRGMWVGLLPPADESDLLNSIQSGSVSSSHIDNKTDFTNYSTADIDNLKKTEHVSLIDMHERGYKGIRSDATVMPFMEALYRAPFELDQKRLQIIDCSNLMLSECRQSANLLSKAGFRVATLNAGLYRQTCKATLTE